MKNQIKKIALALSLFLGILSYAQQKTQVPLKEAYLKRLEKNTLTIIDSSDIYVGDGTSKALFYYALAPKGNY